MATKAEKKGKATTATRRSGTKAKDRPDVIGGAVAGEGSGIAGKEETVKFEAGGVSTITTDQMLDDIIPAVAAAVTAATEEDDGDQWPPATVTVSGPRYRNRPAGRVARAVKGRTINR